jgi:hypothetical protein
MNDMCVYTPIALAGPGSFRMDLFQIAPDYAGQTITFDIYDPGDISGAGNVDIYLDYYNNTRVTTTRPVIVRNLGPQRSNAMRSSAPGSPPPLTSRRLPAAPSSTTAAGSVWRSP